MHMSCIATPPTASDQPAGRKFYSCVVGTEEKKPKHQSLTGCQHISCCFSGEERALQVSCLAGEDILAPDADKGNAKSAVTE